jgi:hypothetical protein
MFSAPLMFRDKAQCATKTQSTRFARGGGSGYSIGKRCNAVAGHQGSALRVSLSALMDCVVPFGKGVTRAGPMSGAQPKRSECFGCSECCGSSLQGTPCHEHGQTH